MSLRFLDVDGLHKTIKPDQVWSVNELRRSRAYGFSELTYSDSEQTRMLSGLRVSANFFQLLGVAPIYGQAFPPDANSPGRNRMIVLSHRLWKSTFSGDPDVVGKTVRLDGEPYRIIGVMGQDFFYPRRDIEYWVPETIDSASPSGRNYLHLLARLKEGVTLSRAQAEIPAG